MKRMFKKAFTLVELLVVIAILGALATVGILSYSAYTKKANNASDNTLLAQLNHQLALMEENPKTYTEMREYLDENAGMEIDRISTFSKNCKYAWNIYDNKLYLVEDGKRIIAPAGEEKELSNTMERHRYYVPIDSDSEVETDGKYHDFACYLRVGATATNGLVTNAGVDCGQNTNVTEVRYINTDATEGQDVVIRTNTFGTKLIVNGPLDTVTHYGYAGLVDVKKVAMSSYDEYGVIGRLTATSNEATGHIDIKAGATVYQVEQNSGVNTSVSVDVSAKVYDAAGKLVANSVTKSATEFTVQPAQTCSHEDTNIFSDGQFIYEVCKDCGYSVITIIDTTLGTTKKDVVGENGEEMIVPISTYTTDNDKVKIDDNGNAKIKDTAEPTIPTPTLLSNAPIQECDHNWGYTSNDDGTHHKVCSKCQLGYDEVCDSKGEEGKCSACGYEVPLPYLTFTAKEANSKVIPAFDRTTNHSWQYSINGGEWIDGHDYDVITLEKVGDYVKLKGTGCKGSYLKSEENYYVKDAKCDIKFDIFDINNYYTAAGDSDSASPLFRFFYENYYIDLFDVDEEFESFLQESEYSEYYNKIAAHFFMLGSIEASGSVSSLNDWTKDVENLDDIFYKCNGVLINTDYSDLK